MSVVYAKAGYPGRINNLNEVHNFTEFIEFALPYGLAKIYMTANRRWCFLERERRKKALAILINRVIRRFAFNIWDVRSAGGNILEDYHTAPVIAIISVLATEYARQIELVNSQGNLTMSTFKLCGEGYIDADLKSRINKLWELKMRRERNLPQPDAVNIRPLLQTEASDVLYELEENLLAAENRNTNKKVIQAIA